MRKESMAPLVYTDFIIHYSTPNKTLTNNEKIYLGNHWTKMNQKYCIKRGLTVSYHQSSYFTES